MVFPFFVGSNSGIYCAIFRNDWIRSSPVEELCAGSIPSSPLASITDLRITIYDTGMGLERQMVIELA